MIIQSSNSSLRIQPSANTTTSFSVLRVIKLAFCFPFAAASTLADNTSQSLASRDISLVPSFPVASEVSRLSGATSTAASQVIQDRENPSSPINRPFAPSCYARELSDFFSDTIRRQDTSTLAQESTSPVSSSLLTPEVCLSENTLALDSQVAQVKKELSTISSDNKDIIDFLKAIEKLKKANEAITPTSKNSVFTNEFLIVTGLFILALVLAEFEITKLKASLSISNNKVDGLNNLCNSLVAGLEDETELTQEELEKLIFEITEKLLILYDAEEASNNNIELLSLDCAIRHFEKKLKILEPMLNTLKLDMGDPDMQEAAEADIIKFGKQLKHIENRLEWLLQNPNKNVTDETIIESFEISKKELSELINLLKSKLAQHSARD